MKYTWKSIKIQTGTNYYTIFSLSLSRFSPILLHRILETREKLKYVQRRTMEAADNVLNTKAYIAS